MTTQQLRIVNLTKKEVLDPMFLGGFRFFDEVAFTSVTGALLWLLNNDWAMDQVAVVSENTRDEDLPQSVDICGIPASQLYAPARHGHARFKAVTKKCREAMARYGHHYDVIQTRTTSVGPQGSTTSTVRAVNWRRPSITERAVALTTHNRPFTIVNHTKGQAVSSTEISSEDSIGSAILNTPDPEDGSLGTGLPVILLLILMASSANGEVYVTETEDLDVDYSLSGFGGSWAGDNISVVISDPTFDGVRIAHSDDEEMQEHNGWSEDISDDLIRAVSANRWLVTLFEDFDVPFYWHSGFVPSTLGGGLS